MFLPKLLPLAALLLVAWLAPAAHAAPFAPKADQWIVELDATPLARRLPPAQQRGAAAQTYAAQLDRQQASVLAQAAPGAKPDVEYRHALAGFAAHLTDAQAGALRSAPGVKRVTRERFLRTSSLAGSEAELLGLPGGFWRDLGGAANAGRGVIVGVVDSGITPELPSFSPKGLSAPASWDGACQGGEAFPTTTCSNKLIGARYFVAGIGAENLPAGAYLSPRDEAGHGTHVAAAAAGDRDVDPSIAGNLLGVDRISGVAPAAHLSVYKACWVTGFCSDVDVIAAVDQAVADGVDVLNLSLGGGFREAPVDPLERALLNADAAGVFVAVAAGNAGDRPRALGSPAAAPWTTAVGATTGTRTFRTTLHAPGADIPVSTVARGMNGVAVVDARSWPGEARYCTDGMTPERVRGKLVICDAAAPLELISEALGGAGAAGVILPVDAQADDPAITGLPPILFAAGADVARLRALAPVPVSFADAAATPWQPDRAAFFSSRGPGDVTDDLLRPDVAAPGVNVLSAYAPDTYLSSLGLEPRERYSVLGGTSMAAPQVAGAAALLTQAHPTWSPAAIRSALVTTARPAIDSDGNGPAPHVAAGAGRIDPRAAADPGLVVEPSTADYEAYAAGDLAPRDLDLPSLSLGKATDYVTVTRTVTSVASARTTYTTAFASDTISPWDVEVSPARFTIAPGQRLQLRISVASATGSAGFRDGTVLLRAPGREVRLPLSIRNPGIVDPPARIEVPSPAPSGEQPVTATVAATVSGVAHGLAAPELRRDQVTTPDGGTHQEYVLPVDVPDGATLLSSEVRFPGAPPELYGFSIHRDVDQDGEFSAPDAAVNDSNHENVDRDDAVTPAPGRYFIHFSGESEQPIHFDLRTWLVDDPRPDEDGLVLDGDPQSAFPAAERTFRLRWSDAAGSEPLRGVVRWYDGDSALAATVVDVEP